MTKKLYRSKHDKMLAGVCAGIAEYFDIDSTLVRLAFAIFTFAYGSGILVYIVCAIIIPERPYDYIEENLINHDDNPDDLTEKKTKKIIGLVIIGIGVIMLIDPFLQWLNRGTIWALALILIGVYLVIKPKQE